MLDTDDVADTDIRDVTKHYLLLTCEVKTQPESEAGAFCQPFLTPLPSVKSETILFK